MINRLTPWLTEKAIMEIDFRLSTFIDGVRILEFGMGVSTLYYVNHPALKSMVSIEHDLGWFSKIGNLVPKDKDFWRIQIPLPYAQKAYEEIASQKEHTFHMILIDGRGREQCLLGAPEYLAPNGFIVLDNSEREAYRYAVAELVKQGFKETCYTQLLPDKWGFTYPGWQTSILSK